jgi:hypothetical protein
MSTTVNNLQINASLLRLARVFLKGLFVVVFVAATFCAFASLTEAATETAVDTTVYSTNTNTLVGSPSSVCVTHDKCFVFYRGAESDIEMASSTDGGVTWSSGRTVDSVNTTDAINVSIWWDGWTQPGTTTQYIHIVTTDTGADDTYYTRYDITNNTLSTTVLVTTQVPVCADGTDCYATITKTPSNILYIAAAEGADRWVATCTIASDCTNTANWSELAGGFQGTAGDDYPILMPIPGTNNVLLTWWDISADAIYYNVYSATSSSWFYASAVSVATAADENTTYDAQLMGMALSTTTGKIALTFVDDANDYSTADHDIRFYTYASTTGWTAKTNVITTAPGGLTGAKVSYDEQNDTWYVFYTRRSTIGTNTTARIFYRTSTNDGTTWSAESDPINATADDINGLSTDILTLERVGVYWNYTTSPKADDQYYVQVADVHPTTLTLSGTLYSNEGTTAITSGKTIKVVVGTSTVPYATSTVSTGSGTWSLTLGENHDIIAATPLLVFVDDDSVNAAHFTKAAGTEDITGLDLYQNRVIVSHEGSTDSATIADMAFYDNTDDSDIQYAATSSPTTTLAISAGNELHIKTGKSFSPGGDVTVHGNAGSGVDGTFHIGTSATYHSPANTTIAGSFIASSSATFYPYGTLAFSATTTGKTITTSGQALGNMSFTGTGEWEFATNATTTNLTIEAGATVVAPANTLTITGDYTNAGTFTHNSGTTTFRSNGSQWTSRTSAADNVWYSVTYGNGLFVAVACGVNSTSCDTTAGNRVMTSPDGITWTSRTSAANNYWRSVTYGNGIFVAVSSSGTGNRVMTSPDGITWTSRTSAADNSWRSVTYGNGLFVAVAASGSGNRVMTSPNGRTWTIGTSAADNYWQSVTYGNGLFVAVSYTGTNNRVMTSPDGIVWTSRTSAEDNDWYSVTYGNGLYVAVSSSGYNNRVMTSPDGITWTSRISAADNYWDSVTYGNGLFVAVACGVNNTACDTTPGNRVMTSPDGITWTSRTSAADNSWQSVTYGNGLFVAVSSDGTGNRVMTTATSELVVTGDDTRQTIAGDATASSAFYSMQMSGTSTHETILDTSASTTNLTIETGKLTLATTTLSINGDYTNNATLNITAENTQWTSRTSAANNGWYSVTYGNGLFVAVSDTGTNNRVMTSPDGITWTSRNAAADNAWRSVTYGNGIFVAVACGYYCSDPEPNQVMTSPDGITWTSHTAVGDDDYWQSVTYDNGLFVAVGDECYWNIGVGDCVMTSSDGVTWTSRTAAADNAWLSITHNNGLFVAVSYTGTNNRVMTSPDGITWTSRTSAADNLWYSVTYGNGLFVAVSENGSGDRVMTSPDGITWTSRTSAADNSWRSVTYGNGLFVAVAASGSGNRVMTSPNGITWTSQNAAAENQWRSVTYGNGLFVAVSLDGTSNRVMTSSSSLSTIVFGGASAQTLQGLMASTSVLGDVVFTGVGVKTIKDTVSAFDFIVHEDATVVVPTDLTVRGEYQNNGTTRYSDRGEDWVARSSLVSSSWWSSITYGNGLFVASAAFSGNRIMYSSDGITWATTTAAGDDDNWVSIT